MLPSFGPALCGLRLWWESLCGELFVHVSFDGALVFGGRRWGRGEALRCAASPATFAAASAKGTAEGRRRRWECGDCGCRSPLAAATEEKGKGGIGDGGGKEVSADGRRKLFIFPAGEERFDGADDTFEALRSPLRMGADPIGASLLRFWALGAVVGFRESGPLSSSSRWYALLPYMQRFSSASSS